MYSTRKLIIGLLFCFVFVLLQPVSISGEAQAEDSSPSELIYKQLRNSGDKHDQRLADRWEKLVGLREWSDASSKFTTNARFLRYDEKTESVTLLITKKTTIAVERLDADGQKHVRQITALIAEMKKASEASHKKNGVTDFALYVSPRDEEVVDEFRKILQLDDPNITLVVATSLPKLVATDAEVLLMVMSTYNDRPSENLLKELKKHKIIGVGDGSATMFGHMGLSLAGGVHFGKHKMDIRLESNNTLRKRISRQPITPYATDVESNDFGMHIPETSDRMRFVDVIARYVGDENYAPIARQVDCIIFCMSTPPSVWSEEYRALFGQIAMALFESEKTPFVLPEFEITPPGTYKIKLARGRSTKEASSKQLYFKFEHPTTFSATLDHNGSDSVMLLFMGDKDRLHWTRKDASQEEGTAGETLRISADITAKDIARHGDKYWHLRVTNFDRSATASCRLKVNYDVEK
jgi:hypothetical protein